ALQKSDAAPEIAALPENSASDVPDKTSHSEPVAVITGTPAASDNDADSPAPPVSSVSPAPVAASASETPESDMSGASDTFSDASAAEEQASEITQTSVAEADVTPDAELIVNAEAHPAASADTAPPENVPRAEPAQPGPAAFGEENAIYVGAQRVAPQPEDAPAQNASRIDQDKLLSRLSHERHSDGKSVIYSLDNTPAFTDRGNRLVMAEGASADEEKVLAALLNAAKFYHGKIELTGSDEFKAFAINVIVNNGLQVSMKNPGQQLALEEAKRLAGQPAAVPDMVRGEPVAAPVTAAASPVPPATPVAQPVTAASPETPAVPVSAPVSSENSKPMPATPVSDATISSPTKPTIRPDIHTPAESAREPVTGKVTAHGKAPFRFEQGNQESVFITLRTREGSQTFWGKELAGLIRDTRLRDGQMVTLQWMGQQPVTVNKPLKDRDGNFTGDYEPVQTNRNQWALTSVRGTRVQTGGDEMLKLSAFSANRYTQIQHAVASQLNIALSAPPKPADGLYWFRPDGQGSSSAGDALSALRPDHNQHAGKAVMSSWGADGKPDLYLVQGDGQYLQGVLRQGDTYQHVLASLPDRKDAPKMVINILTPEGAKPVGSGNGVNRSDGKPIPREHVAFRVTGDEKVRIAKLQEPASIPPALHARLGYDERYKAEPVYPKEQPAAALQATPATINRPA
ncbi:TPA: DNA primase, partial [Enterobacter hormaechei]|nr:DNA primase [Enterobacter hormaechei]